VQRVDGGDGGGDVGALDVDVALRRRLVHKDVHGAAVVAALVDHVVADVQLPVGLGLPAQATSAEAHSRHPPHSLLGVEHVRQHEALRGDGWRSCRLLAHAQHLLGYLRQFHARS